MRMLSAIILALGLAGCAASGGRSPRGIHETQATAVVERPAEPVAEGPATRPKGSERLPPNSFEDYLRGLQRTGLYSQRNVDDVLLARTQLLKQLDHIPADFSGYAASTIEGKLYTTKNDSVKEVLDWLDQNNQPARLGFFTWVNTGDEGAPAGGTERLPESGLEAYLSRRQRSGALNQRQVDDVRFARTQLLKQLDRIPPDFSGWAASTIDGKLYTTTEGRGTVLEWLDQNSPPGRWGFFTWVKAAQSDGVVYGTSTQPITQPGTGTSAPWEDFGPSTTRSTPPNK